MWTISSDDFSILMSSGFLSRSRNWKLRCTDNAISNQTAARVLTIKKWNVLYQSESQFRSSMIIIIRSSSSSNLTEFSMIFSGAFGTLFVSYQKGIIIFLPRRTIQRRLKESARRRRNLQIVTKRSPVLLRWTWRRRQLN